MARDRSSITKQSRREKYALHPKAQRIMTRRANPPGQHGPRGSRRSESQYGIQLREKQKVKRTYGLLEKQFSNLMKEASRTKGKSGEVLLKFLELRLDNAVYRSSLANSRRSARQLVTHGHFLLNGKRVDIPSIRLKAGDKIEVRSKSATNEYFKNLDNLSPSDSAPAWLKVERKKLTITVMSTPSREDAEPDIKEQLIVEYYSK